MVTSTVTASTTVTPETGMEGVTGGGGGGVGCGCGGCGWGWGGCGWTGGGGAMTGASTSGAGSMASGACSNTTPLACTTAFSILSWPFTSAGWSTLSSLTTVCSDTSTTTFSLAIVTASTSPSRTISLPSGASMTRLPTPSPVSSKVSIFAPDWTVTVATEELPLTTIRTAPSALFTATEARRELTMWMLSSPPPRMVVVPSTVIPFRKTSPSPTDSAMVRSPVMAMFRSVTSAEAITTLP